MFAIECDGVDPWNRATCSRLHAARRCTTKNARRGSGAPPILNSF